MTGFSIGDKVEVVDGQGGFDVLNGKHGVVSAVHDSINEHPVHVLLDGDHRPNRFATTELQHQEKAVPEAKFKVDDRVRVTDNTTDLELNCAPTVAAGKIGTVTYCGGNNRRTGDHLYRVQLDDDGHSHQYLYLERALSPLRTAEEVQAEFDAFKGKVVAVAVREAKARDWCSDIEGFFEEVGLEWPKRNLRVTLELDIDGYDFDDDHEFSKGDAADVIEDRVAHNLRDIITSVEEIKS